MVPAATSTTSAWERSTANSAWSAGLPKPPDTPATAVAPSMLAIMLSRTAGRIRADGRSPYSAAGSTGSQGNGRSCRISRLRRPVTRGAGTYDVLVSGAGPAGEHAAGRLAGAGLRVAIVERELVGGECSYWGCIPSKTLIRPGDVLAAARRAPGAAEAVTGQLDADAAFAQRDYMTSDWHDDSQLPWLEGKGIELVRGTARLT